MASIKDWAGGSENAKYTVMGKLGTPKVIPELAKAGEPTHVLKMADGSYFVASANGKVQTTPSKSGAKKLGTKQVETYAKAYGGKPEPL